jgi:hypothetical protein
MAMFKSVVSGYLYKLFLLDTELSLVMGSRNALRESYLEHCRVLMMENDRPSIELHGQYHIFWIHLEKSKESDNISPFLDVCHQSIKESLSPGRVHYLCVENAVLQKNRVIKIDVYHAELISPIMNNFLVKCNLLYI